MFKTPFGRYVCVDDTITCEVDGFDCTARIYRDDTPASPPERDEGFWPSLDPKSPGYIGPRSKRTLQRHMAKARAVMSAWEHDKWFYCGVAVTIAREGVKLTPRYQAALWGIDCNYPGSDNAYLLEVANELLPEALDDARAKLAKLAA